MALISAEVLAKETNAAVILVIAFTAGFTERLVAGAVDRLYK
jgi:hypothetical protein